jgi:hypothetical protein
VDYIEQRYTGLLDNTSDGIEEILNDDDSKITTINQSQSVAEGRIVRDLWNDAKENPEFRSNLAEHLGLDPDVNDRELAQALVDDVGDVVSNSEAIAESKQRFDEVSRRAAEAGITHVVTSGNLGTFASEMDRLGVETDRQFYDSAFVNRHTLVVAASNETGRGGPTSASFNSPNANADVSAPGVNIDITTQDGASETNSRGGRPGGPDQGGESRPLPARDRASAGANRRPGQRRHVQRRGPRDRQPGRGSGRSLILGV